MEKYGARAVVVIIANGSLGTGMSAICDDKLVAALPALLRDAADQAEKNPTGIV